MPRTSTKSGPKPLYVSLCFTKGEVSTFKRHLHKKGLKVRSFARTVRGGNGSVQVFLVCAYKGQVPNA